MNPATTIVIATRNKGKTAEIASLLKDFPVVLKNLDDFGPIPEVVEDGNTFDENAYKKASFTARVLGYPALADDSGLVVDALGGRPGVYSARYGGEGLTDAERCERLLEEMKGLEDRSASFECVISIAMPMGQALTYEGRCEGDIIDSMKGEGGFGYDPVFRCRKTGKTFAEMSMDEKAAVSHRGNALSEVRGEFDKILVWIRQHMPIFEKKGCVHGDHS